jgi:hypothetical protein
MFVVPVLIFPLILNKRLKKEAAKVYDRYPFGEDEGFSIIFDELRECFFIGRGENKFPIGENTIVYLTKKHHLFYHGHGKKDEKFYIPKEGDTEYRAKVITLENYLKENRSVKYIEKSKG